MRESNEPLGLIEVAIEPANRADRPRMVAALQTLVAQNRSIAFSTDPDAGTIMKAQSESDLEIAIDALSRMFGFKMSVGAPQVAYRETLKKAVEIDFTHKKQAGGSGEFARVRIAFEPLPSGSGYLFEDQVVGGAVPKAYIPGVERGLNASRMNGVLVGYPLIDFKACLVDGAYHEVDSNERTFEIAAQGAVRELKRVDAVKLLEPVMTVKVTTPDEFIGGVIGDLNARRGSVQATDQQGETQVVTALTPLDELFGYGRALAGITRGRGAFSMRFAHYDDAPHAPDDDDFPPAAALRA